MISMVKLMRAMVVQMMMWGVGSRQKLVDFIISKW